MILYQIDQQSLLFVRLGDCDLVEIDPVRLIVTTGSSEEKVIGPDRRLAVAFLRVNLRFEAW